MKKFYIFLLSAALLFSMSACKPSGIQEIPSCPETQVHISTSETPTEATEELFTQPPETIPAEPVTLPPTQAPTEAITQAPTELPTETPTEVPTELPTEAPTEAPTEVPTEAPTQAPTTPPTTAAPTEAPTEAVTQAPTVTPTEAPTEAPKPAPTPTEDPSDDQEGMVWIPKSGKKYHSNPKCSNMKDPSHVTIDEAKDRGFTPCKKCYG